MVWTYERGYRGILYAPLLCIVCLVSCKFVVNTWHIGEYIQSSEVREERHRHCEIRRRYLVFSLPTVPLTSTLTSTRTVADRYQGGRDAIGWGIGMG